MTGAKIPNGPHIPTAILVLHIIFVIFIGFKEMMLFNRHILFCILLFAAKGLVAQQPVNYNLQQCATDEVRQYLESGIPGMRNRAMEINQKIQTYINGHQAEPFSGNRYFPGGPDFIIPVVVHIVHNGEPVGSGTNISFAQVKSQIDALNAGFSNYNGSLNYYQALAGTQFASLAPGLAAVDTRIRFCLATNPGNRQVWTNAAEPGIMRYNSPANSRHEYTIAGQTALLNLTQPGTAFSSNHYLNIWVVTAIRFNGNSNSGDCPGIQGYASIAGYTGPAARVIEGVVIRSDVTGDNFITGNTFNLQPNANPACANGMNQSQSDRGKILIHEVGHFLGLYHTFQDCISSSAAQCNSTGDLVCDTNPCDQPGSSLGCGPSDMPENFMYYSPDPVLNTFTAGQRERMHAMLATERASLVTESNVLETGVLGPDGCFAGTVMPQFTMPAVLCVNQPATFMNVGQGTGVNLANQWQWTVTPAAGVTIDNPAGATANITFTIRGSYTVSLTVSQSGSTVRNYQQVVQVVACELQDCRKDKQKWIFGWGMVGVDFSEGEPKPFSPAPFSSIDDGNQESYFTLTDPQTGNIIMYTNGINLYDASFNRVNTSSLHPLPTGTFNSNAQFICLPYPEHNGQYILLLPSKGFSDPDIIGVANNYPSHAVYLVDLNGTPSIAPFSCNINFTGPAGVTFDFNRNSVNEQVTAIPHANGRDYWIVYPASSINGSVYLVSFLLNPAGLTQQEMRFIVPGSLLPYGHGIVANPSHNRVAFKHVNMAAGVNVVTVGFDNRKGIFTGTPLSYNTDANSIPYPGGIIFYDDTRVYLSRVGGAPNTGLYELDLVNGSMNAFGDNIAYSRFSLGPDGEIYTLFKPRSYGPGSNGLARIDRVAGAPVVNIAIPALQLTPTLPTNTGINFWNMQESIQCPPPPASTDFIFSRQSCNSFRFHIPDSALWTGYTLVWDFGDGSPVVNSLPSAPVLHTYSAPGIYDVSLQLSVSGCAGTVFLPSPAVIKHVTVFDENQPISISGPLDICIGTTPLDYTYSTIQSPQANYTWAVTGDAQIRDPFSGTGINEVQVLFGQSPGPRTLTVQFSEASCSLNGSVIVNLTMPGISNAGDDGTITVCNNAVLPIVLNDIITGEQPGGTWTRLSGTGGIFDAVAGTFIPSPAAGNSIFQYIISGLAGCNTADSSRAIINVIPFTGAGTDGGLQVCNNRTQPIGLFSLLTGAQPGGTWARLTGTGGNFDAVAGTFTVSLTATDSRFQYVVTGNNGCGNDTSFADITVNQQPDAGQDGSLSVCDSQVSSINLFNIITGEQPGGTWTLTSGSGGSLDPNTGIFSQPFAAGTYRFTYRLNGTTPCVNDESEAVIRYGDFDPLNDSQLSTCFGEHINIDSLYNLTGYTIISNWSYNGSPVTDPTAVSAPGLYELIIGDGGNCTDTINVQINQRPPVRAVAIGDSIAVQNVLFSLNATGGGSYLWTWSPSNAIVSNTQVSNPIIRLTDPVYLFYLEVTDAAGCKGYDTLRIKVFKGPTYYVPNAFSPNNDGLNDRFSALPVGITSTEWFRIYNRYGQLVFETAAPVKGWDGRFKGKIQDTGTFTWLIKGRGYNNQLVEMKGTVILIR